MPLESKKQETGDGVIGTLKTRVHDLEEELLQKEDLIEKMKKLQIEYQASLIRRPSKLVPRSIESLTSTRVNYHRRHETKTLLYSGWGSVESDGLSSDAKEERDSHGTRVGVAVT